MGTVIDGRHQLARLVVDGRHTVAGPGRDAGSARVVGHERQLAALDAALDRMAEPDGPPAEACVIQGEPGVGKTTLWSHAARQARERGFEVLSCRLGESERHFPFAGLTDLVETVPDAAFHGLPAPQRQALRAALLRTPAAGTPPDPHAVSLAVLGVVRVLEAQGPVLLAVDDAQWLDGATANVLSYVARRCGGARVGLLVAVRTGDRVADPLRSELERAVGPDRLRRITLGRMDPSDLRRLVQARTGVCLATPELLRLNEACAGIPSLALEIMRALELDPAAGPSVDRTRFREPDWALPVPNVHRRAAAEHVGRLSADVRDVLLIAAALPSPTTASIRAVLGLADQAVPALDEAEEAGVLQVDDGRVTFTHPLFASAVYAAAAGERRRALHARLADVATDLDQRAWHLAFAVDGPCGKVADIVDHAAAQAQARGMPARAADLWSLSSRRTPPEDPRRLERAVSAAECRFYAGDGTGARHMLERAVSDMPPGHRRARALLRLAPVVFHDGGPEEAVAVLHAALREAAGDRSLTGMVHLRIAWLADFDTGLQLAGAEAAQRLLAGEADAEARACALLAAAYFGFQAGRAPDHAAMERGRRLLPARDFSWDGASARAVLSLWQMSFDPLRARADLRAAYRRAHEVGDESLIPRLLLHLAELECRLGDTDLAARHAAEATETARQTGQGRYRSRALHATALVAAYQGDLRRAAADATEGLALAGAPEDPAASVLHLSVLGFVELSLGRPGEADRHLTRAFDLVEAMGMSEPARYHFFADQVEVCLQLGELRRAEALVVRLERRAGVSRYPYLECTAARSRALLALALADPDGALAAVEAAVRAHAELPMPFELARTQLVQAQVLRRVKRKRAAHTALGQAHATFVRFGAATWAERATAELRSLGMRRNSPTELTAAEKRVADLVTEGRTNDEVASALFLSRRTVEAHLGRIYRKIGVRSRTELARALSGAGETGPARRGATLGGYPDASTAKGREADACD
ncbi:AAA family ATPase [Streptomyces sp. NPDC049040]|uniref:AAA family ATPase n=1 Tax=Streptomyces sp. NPDC049040 TaxID=3365593 RepID=UPI0037143F62